jgi:hypothetical protein
MTTIVKISKEDKHLTHTEAHKEILEDYLGKNAYKEIFQIKKPTMHGSKKAKQASRTQSEIGSLGSL